MKAVKAKPNQTIYDVALEQYGNAEAIAEIMTLNPGLRNDPAALARMGVDTISDDGFYIDASLLPGAAIVIDNDSALMRPMVLKELTGDEITTFDLQ